MMILDDRASALLHESRLACGSMVLTIYPFLVFALAERKNEKQKKIKYRCENQSLTSYSLEHERK